ncbi:MAG: hypothetical protein LBU48_04850 [Coriobacteriales bacterium]|nr:hypothetical protein [Coriobacteriales bacterium]
MLFDTDQNDSREPNSSPISEQHRSADAFLDAADAAAMQGNARLAIHLYCAAFETLSQPTFSPSGRAIKGLQEAWQLAYELGDRSMAETILSDLMPYVDPQEIEQGTRKLQELAVSQLEEFGLSRDDLKNMASMVSAEIMQVDSDELMDSLKQVLDHIGLDDKPQLAVQKLQRAALAPAGTPPKAVHKQQEQQAVLNYALIAGYGSTLERMREFGFQPAGDFAFKSFVEQAATLHGVQDLALLESFVFYGPSREDVAFFAHATAAEIGWPVLDIAVDLDKQGSGSIKLSGPFRGSPFGPPDLTEIPMPCTVLIENIDFLQDMFANEQKALLRNDCQQRRNGGRSVQAEVMAYLRALINKDGVFVIVTAQKPNVVREPLAGLISPLVEIEVAPPKLDERKDIWLRFSKDHPSFKSLDFERLSRLSEGISRRDLVVAGRASVETAYRDSLRTGRHREVSFGEVLAQLASFIDHGSAIYRELEDVAVAEFASNLDLDAGLDTSIW